MVERLILIAPRFDFDFYEFLKRKFAGDPTVVVIAERRAAWQRRKQNSVDIPDRRHADRRRRNTVGLIVAGRSADSAVRQASQAGGPA
jgi:hypothetical protein